MFRAVLFFSHQSHSLASKEPSAPIGSAILDANYQKFPKDSRSTKEILDEQQKRLADDPAFREQHEKEQGVLDKLYQQFKDSAKEQAIIDSRCPHKHGY